MIRQTISQIPWTKTLLEDFIEEALLTEDEEKVIRTKLEGWSIIKQSLDLDIGSTATISRIIKRINDKYNKLSSLYPDRFPKRSFINQSFVCPELIGDLVTTCNKDILSMSKEDLAICQETCPYRSMCK